jgi:hypothetical protein
VKNNNLILTTPVLFLVFNRLDTTKQVFEAIRQAKPPKLFIAADGPRVDRDDEAEDCDTVRQFIMNNIDWECEVKTLFRDQNLGCRVAVSSAIDWFFENVEAGIILEDDCLPHPDFFNFCQDMLEYYRNDESIMHISGANFQFGKQRGDGSYYFSRYAHIWGWASWRRAWQYYDVNMKSFPNFKEQNIIGDIFPDKKIQCRWLEILDKIYSKDPIFNTWDFQWAYTVLLHQGRCITPNCNLISNIGGSATHEINSKHVDLKLCSLGDKVLHPCIHKFCEEADLIIYKGFIAKKNIIKRILLKIKKIKR